MSPPPTVLVVEDSEDDLFFLRRALKSTGSAMDVRCLNDGKHALRYLRGEGEFADRTVHPLPDLAFLDLKMPLLSGLELLAAIRSDPKLRSLRVYVLTSSDEPRDREGATARGVEGYLVKPARTATLAPIVSTLAAAGATGTAARP